jgi:hypothetical protein
LHRIKEAASLSPRIYPSTGGVGRRRRAALGPQSALGPSLFPRGRRGGCEYRTAALTGACRRLPAVLARRFVGDALRRCYRWYERLR